jgi:hypothetical protein
MDDRSFVSRLRAAKALQRTQREAQSKLQDTDDLWLDTLAAVNGELSKDGTEYITSQLLLEILQVPLNERTAGTYRHIAGLMVSLGWQPVRVFGLNARGSMDQIRGYARDTRERRQQTLQHSATKELENAGAM